MKGKKYGKEAGAENFLWERVMKKNPCWIVQWSPEHAYKMKTKRYCEAETEVQKSQMPWDVGDQRGNTILEDRPHTLLGELSEWNLGKQTFLSFYVKKLRLRE